MATATVVLFPWRDAYSVGIVQIDNQHKQLIGLINSLHAAMREGDAASVQTKIMDELARYTWSHFAFEESLLHRHNYSGLAAHAQEHQRMVAQVADMRESLRTGKLTATLGLMQFLKEWLSGHILERDQAYARELKGL